MGGWSINSYTMNTPAQSSAPSNGWYVVYTKPKHENKVHQQLLADKYEAYLPLKKHHSVWSDRQKVLYKPLFPSYVFVYLDNIALYYKILKIYGTLAFIMFAGKFATVTEDEINKIKQVLAECNNIEVSSEDFSVGEKRKIMAGVFCGFDCEVIRHKGKKKILVRIDSLKQNIVAELNTSYFSNYSY
ncbi:MAG: UpxY family transcription antiterminator [Dysgonamonadaceae bacterium]|nr:UpxY family transcription antiterminator [Dysgonamonadaceae bacterium]